MTAIRLLFDTKLMRPGCVLLQAVAGCDTYRLSDLFDAETWLTHPTPDMKRLTGTPEQWRELAALVATGRAAKP